MITAANTNPWLKAGAEALVNQSARETNPVA